MPNPTFVDGLIVKTHTFDNGGEIIKLSFKVEEFAVFLRDHEKDGWLNIDICTSKKNGKKYAVLNEYKKQDQEEVLVAPPQTKREEHLGNVKKIIAGENQEEDRREVPDDLPFH